MRIKSILVLALVTLIIWQIILPTVNLLNLPLNKTYGIVSRLVIDGRSPLTNYAIYLILFLGPSFAILGFLFLRGQITKLNLDFKKGNLLLLRITDKFRLLPVALFLTIACWLLNVKHQPMVGSNGKFAQDGFHFGEIVGLSETFLQNPGLFYNKAYLMVHGFGLNVLPGFIGLTLGGDDRDIAVSGLVVDAHYTISTILAFLIMLEIATYISARSKWKIFSLFILVYFCLHNIALAFLDRDIIFLIQAFISLRWLRLERNDDANIKFNSSRIIYPALLGFFIPISFLYVYDRAIYFTVLLIYLFTYFLTIKNIRFCLKCGLVTFLSTLLTCFIFSKVFGFSYLTVTFNQISYWSKYSGLFTGLAYPEINIKLMEIANWLAIFLQSCSLTILCLKFNFGYSKRITFKSFLYENSIEIFLLLCAVITMRVALGRSDDWYLTSRGFFAIFSFITIISRPLFESSAQSESHFSLSAIQRKILPSFSSVFIIVLLLCSLFNMNSVAAAINVFGLLSYPSSVKAILSKTNSELLNPSYLEVARQIKDDITGSCFYTLTSEGVWYRIFSMKPCSKYWYLLYSTSIKSQKELVKELQAEKPKIILYSNQFWSNRIDGVPKETSHLLVHQYVWQHYRPYKMLNGNWFWIHRADEELYNLFVPHSDKVVGLFDGIQIDNNKKLDVLASGWSIVGKENSEQSTVFLTYNLINSPNNLEFLGVGSVSAERYDVATALNEVSAIYSGWNISFNRLNVPPENVVLRAWAYNAEDHKLYEIPSASPPLVKGELPIAKRIVP